MASQDVKHDERDVSCKRPLGQADHGDSISSLHRHKKLCRRHKSDSIYRQASDESQMAQIQNDLTSMPVNDQQAITRFWTLFSAAPSKQREIMLHGILAQCCFPQLSLLAEEVHKQLRIDFLTALPTEIALQILSHLDTVSLCKAAQVSQAWNALADADSIWKNMCQQHINRKCTKCGWGLPLVQRKLSRLLSPPDSPEGSVSSSPAPVQTTKPWKDIYKDGWRVESNWKKGRYTVTTLDGHRDGITCLQLSGKILATGSYDTTIAIWDAETGHHLRTLEGHTSGIKALCFDGFKLFSASLDGTVRGWNWSTGASLCTIDHGNDGVVAVDIRGSILVTGSMDNTIRVWDFESKQKFILEGHADFVNQVQVDIASRTILSASDDATVRLWDMDARTCIKIFDGHMSHVQQVLALPSDFQPDLSGSTGVDESNSTIIGADVGGDDLQNLYGVNFGPASSRELPPRHILTGSLDATVKLWDTRTGQCLGTWFGHIEGIWGLGGDHLKVVTCGQDGLVKLWDPRTGACVSTFTGHTGPVTCVDITNQQMVSGGQDGRIRLYHFH